MDALLPYLLLSLGFFLGLLIGFVLFLIKKSKFESSLSELVRLQGMEEKLQLTSGDLVRLQEKSQFLDEVRAEKDQWQLECGLQKESNAELRARLEERQGNAEKEEGRIKELMENMAQRTLDQNSEKFSKSHKDSLKTLLEPFQKELGSFKERVESIHAAESKELHLLKELNQKMASSTENLTKALKGDSKVQGNWGEMQLEMLLEDSGLIKGKNYLREESFNQTNDAGETSRSRPDVILLLPDKKQIIIDAKVNLTAYERYSSAANEAEAAIHLKEHVAAIKTQIKGLSAKSYHQIAEIKTLDFVIMFIPIEPALLVALQAESQLFRDAQKQRVMIAGPSTLQMVLATIYQIWKQDDQGKNALKIASEAGKLYDKFVGFANTLEEVGRNITKAQGAYDKAHKQLTSGAGNLVGKTQLLKDLGASADKELPEHLKQAADLSNELVKTTETAKALPTVDKPKATSQIFAPAAKVMPEPAKTPESKIAPKVPPKETAPSSAEEVQLTLPE
ncbi:MAG: DNA recombination protein RmuC [SAR324 cluster bacterium]|nr:DNA recombination protein RmuC [SAR324 cluster bacterium]